MRTLIVVLTALVGGQAVHAQDKAVSTQQILECARANTPDKSFSQQASFVTTSVDGKQRALQARILGLRGSDGLKLNLRVLAPASTAGVAVLVRERAGQDDMRIFMPATNRTQQVTGSMAATKLLGTDFSYLDLKQMYGAMLDGTSAYVGLDSHGGREVHRLDYVPAAEEGAPYDTVSLLVDKQTCVPLLAEFKSQDGELMRSLTADIETLTAEKGRHYARIYRLADLISETTTTVELSQVTYDSRLSRSAFHPVSFKDAD